jgi:MT0933-like antitoxin protein
MGIDFEGLKNKAEDLVREHGDQIGSGVEKAGEFAKGKIGHHETVDKVVGKIQGLIPAERGDGEGQDQGGEPRQP